MHDSGLFDIFFTQKKKEKKEKTYSTGDAESLVAI